MGILKMTAYEVKARHARYYLQQLYKLEKDYSHATQSGISAINDEIYQEWPQIEYAQAWSAEHHPEFCAGFALPGLVGWALRQNVLETNQVRWFEQAIQAYPRIHRRDPLREIGNLAKWAKKMQDNSPPGDSLGGVYQFSVPSHTQEENLTGLIWLGPLYWGLGQALTNEGRYAEAEKALRKASREKPPANHGNQVIHFFGTANSFSMQQMSNGKPIVDRHQLTADLGYLYLRMRKFRRAEKLMRQALGEAQRFSDINSEAIILGNLGLVAAARGKLDEAERSFLDAIYLAKQCEGGHGIEAMQLDHLGKISLRRRNLPMAKEYLQAAFDLYSSLNDARGRAESLAHLGCLRLLEGRVIEALDLVDQACAIADVHGEINTIQYTQAILTKVQGYCVVGRNDYSVDELLGVKQSNTFRKVYRQQRIAYFRDFKHGWMLPLLAIIGFAIGCFVVWQVESEFGFGWRVGTGPLGGALIGLVLGGILYTLNLNHARTRTRIRLFSAINAINNGNLCDTSEMDFQSAVRKYPNDLMILLAWATWLDLHGRNDEVIDTMRSKTLLVVGDHLLACQFAWALADSGHFDDAEKWCHLAELHKNSHPEIMPLIADTRAWIHYRHDRLEAALETLKPALTYADDCPEIAYHAAAIMNRLGRVPEAKNYLKLALASRKPFSGRSDAERLDKKLP